MRTSARAAAKDGILVCLHDLCTLERTTNIEEVFAAGGRSHPGCPPPGAWLLLTPYIFRSAGTPAGQTVEEEMATFPYDIGVDAVFTDNPDRFPIRDRP